MARSAPSDGVPKRGRDGTADMHLSEHDLQQLDDDYLRGLSADPLWLLSGKLPADFNDAHGRPNQNPSDSSCPPSTRAPWEKSDGGSEEGCASEAIQTEALKDRLEEAAAASPVASDSSTPLDGDAAPQGETWPGRPARRGALAVSRTQVLPGDAEKTHRPETCTDCGARLREELEHRPDGTRFANVVSPDGGKGLALQQTKPSCIETDGHRTRTKAGRTSSEVRLDGQTQRKPPGRTDAGDAIFALAPRMRLSRARIQEVLRDGLGLDAGVADRALRHSAIAQRIGNGIRGTQGSMACANLPSIIETCRKRSVSPFRPRDGSPLHSSSGSLSHPSCSPRISEARRFAVLADGMAT